MEQLSAFFRWWFSELGSLLPARLRAQPGRRLNTLRFQVHPRSVEVGEFSDGTLKKLAELPRGPKGELNAEPEFLHSLQTLLTRRFPVGRSVVEVGLPSGSALAREVELPLPAEENLRGVLGFEMERLTPFRVDDIYYAGQVIHRDTTTRKLNVGLLAVPRAQVDPILGLLPSDARGFLSDEAIVQQEGDGSVVVFRPTYIESAGRKGRLWALVAINVALIIALIAVPLWRQGQVLDELKREVRAATASAGEASAVQDRIDAVKREMVQISEVKASRPPAVETMEEISRLLPDSTWLSRFEIRAGQIQLRGSSAAASGLIETLESSPLLANVRFASPVTLEPASGRERFHLTAQLMNRTSQTTDGEADSDKSANAAANGEGTAQ